MVVERQSRPLVTFSTLSMVYQERDRQLQQQTQQQTQQQEELFERRKITIKPKVVQVALASAPTPVSEKQSLQSEKTTKSNPKIIIIIKNQQQQQQRENEKQEEEDKQRKKITIVKRRFKYFDIAPPATMCFIPKNDLYRTPPPNCCRFFIENKHCFLRERDNACICPTSTTVIGFWNEKVGNECKLLPVEDETTYEEATAVVDKTFPEEAQLQLTSSVHSSHIPSPKLKTKSPSPPIPKSKFVSDAQRARIAFEPIALLREKLAKQYGVVAKKN